MDIGVNMSKPNTSLLVLQTARPNKQTSPTEGGMRAIPTGQKQQGSTIIVVLLVMMAVTIIGVMSINTSVVDLRIARNEKRLRQTFYLSDGVAMEAGQRLADTAPIDLEEKHSYWHHAMKQVRAEGIDFRRLDDWVVDGDEEDNALASPMGPDLFMAAVEWRLATGSSAIATGPRLYLNRVYGLYRGNNAGQVVEIGYYLRY